MKYATISGKSLLHNQTMRRIAQSANSKVTGVLGGDQIIRVQLQENATSADINAVEAALANYKTLALQTDKATIQADGAEMATITCSDPAIAADAALSFFVSFDGLDDSDGEVPVVAGTATLTLQTNVPGAFLIEVWRKAGTFAHGFIIVTAE